MAARRICPACGHPGKCNSLTAQLWCKPRPYFHQGRSLLCVPPDALEWSDRATALSLQKAENSWCINSRSRLNWLSV
jgi:hypothetical protein